MIDLSSVIAGSNCWTLGAKNTAESKSPKKTVVIADHNINLSTVVCKELVKDVCSDLSTEIVTGKHGCMTQALVECFIPFSKSQKGHRF